MQRVLTIILIAGSLSGLAAAGGAAAPEVARHLDLVGTALEVRPERISVVEPGGKILDTWDSAPFVVLDACADPSRPFVYAVLGRRDAERGERFAVLELQGKFLRLTHLDRDRRLNPWKVLSGDVDGDGQAEVVFAVYKKARFHPVLANRPFVFEWDGRRFIAKWLGSRLSQPFLDLALKDLNADGVCEIVALEQQRDGSQRIMSYRWNGFGFTTEREIARDLHASSLRDLAY